MPNFAKELVTKARDFVPVFVGHQTCLPSDRTYANDGSNSLESLASSAILDACGFLTPLWPGASHSPLGRLPSLV